MKLPNEQVLVGALTGGLCVTTHRIRFSGYVRGGAVEKEIFLEDVSFSVIEYSSPLLLAIGVVVVIFGLFLLLNNSGAVGLWTMASGLVLIGIFLATRASVLTFSSSGGSIVVRLDRKKHDAARSILKCVSAAKEARRTGVAISRASV